MSVLILRSSGGSEFRTSYSTGFAADESPYSDGGVWSRTDLNSKPIISTGGICIGTQDGTGGYDDSQGSVTGFDPTARLRAEATLFRSGSINAENHEVELCFRTVETTTTTKKYEGLWDRGGQFVWIKWLGNHNFDQFIQCPVTSGSGSSPTPQDDWRIRCECETVGSTVVLRGWYATAADPTTWNLMAISEDDGTVGGVGAYLSGMPGVGMYIPNTSANPAHFGLKDYSVTTF
jgi:hypothetical protein